MEVRKYYMGLTMVYVHVRHDDMFDDRLLGHEA